MAELVLTDEEKAASYWSELDDVSLGRFLRCSLQLIVSKEDERNEIMHQCSAIMLCGRMHQSNADTMELKLEGLTSKGVEMGDFQITIKRSRIDAK